MIAEKDYLMAGWDWRVAYFLFLSSYLLKGCGSEVAFLAIYFDWWHSTILIIRLGSHALRARLRFLHVIRCEIRASVPAWKRRGILFQWGQNDIISWAFLRTSSSYLSCFTFFFFFFFFSSCFCLAGCSCMYSCPSVRSGDITVVVWEKKYKYNTSIQGTRLPDALRSSWLDRSVSLMISIAFWKSPHLFELLYHICLRILGEIDGCALVFTFLVVGCYDYSSREARQSSREKSTSSWWRLDKARHDWIDRALWVRLLCGKILSPIPWKTRADLKSTCLEGRGCLEVVRAYAKHETSYSTAAVSFSNFLGLCLVEGSWCCRPGETLFDPSATLSILFFIRLTTS